MSVMTAESATRLRRARKRHTACGGYCPPIKPGELYLEHTEFPGGDSGYADAAGHPVRMAECRDCAERYGRGHLFSKEVADMARDHGRLLCRIWNDKEFRALTRAAQALYAQLISQQTITNCGVLPLMVSKWSKGCDEISVQEIIADLAVLVDARFIVVDTDTEEVLVRSFIRNDGVLKQPNVFKNALKVAETIESPVIRRVLAAELRRLNRTDATHTAALIDSPESDPAPIVNPSETLPDTITNGSVTLPISDEQNPSSNPSETLREGRRVREPFADPSGEGVGEGEKVQLVGNYVGGVARADTRAARAHVREGNPDPDQPPSPYCPRHTNGTDEPCGQCADRRKKRQQFDAEAVRDAALAAAQQRDAALEARRRAIADCPLGCADGYLDDGQGSRSLCDHRPPNPDRPTLRTQFEALRRAEKPQHTEDDHG